MIQNANKARTWVPWVQLHMAHLQFDLHFSVTLPS